MALSQGTVLSASSAMSHDILCLGLDHDRRSTLVILLSRVGLDPLSYLLHMSITFNVLPMLSTVARDITFSLYLEARN